MSPTVRWSLLLTGLALLVGVPLGWSLLQPPAQVGEVPDAASSATDADTDPGTEPEPSPPPVTEDPRAAADEPDAPVVPASTTTSRPALPVAISLPAIGVVDASVVQVGLDDRGAVEIPDDVREVGWYRLGPRPGEPGNAFFTSHVDSRTQGRGVLFDLRRSEPGDPVEVRHADGSVTTWQVVARERIDKGTYPFERVFRFDGEPGLVIDTCGGRFDPTTGSYESIDIVYAVPAAGDLGP